MIVIIITVLKIEKFKKIGRLLAYALTLSVQWKGRAEQTLLSGCQPLFGCLESLLDVFLSGQGLLTAALPEWTNDFRAFKDEEPATGISFADTRMELEMKELLTTITSSP